MNPASPAVAAAGRPGPRASADLPRQDAPELDFFAAPGRSAELDAERLARARARLAARGPVTVDAADLRLVLEHAGRWWMYDVNRPDDATLEAMARAEDALAERGRAP